LPERVEPSALAKRIQQKRDSGAEMLDLTESNPTRAGFIYPEEDILRGFQDRRALSYDPESLGLPHARAQIANLHGVDPERILITASTSEAYSWVFKLLCDPGDEILIPHPSYPLFELLARLESVVVRSYPIRYHHGWFIDLDALASSFTDRTRAVVVVNPNNPTGSYLKRDEWERLMALCSARGCALISDEVFADYSLEEVGQRVSAIEDGSALSFTLNGLSKLVGLPQMKLGWMTLSGPEHLRRRAMSRLEIIADTYLSVGAPVQYALPSLLSAREGLQSQILERLRSNLAFARSAFAGTPATVLDVEGGWYAVTRVPNVRSEEEWVRLLLERGVLVQPGYFYDFESEGYLVLSLLTPRNVFEEGVTRLVESVR
jgi:hypothetical protein